MKFFLLSFLLSFVFIQSSLSQNLKSPAPTTEDEYNYVTKGYQIQKESGLDMKKGYHFNDLFDKTQGNYSFNCKSLVRDGSKEVAALMIITNSAISGKTYNICIPFNNTDLTSRYWADISLWDRALTTAYTQVVSGYLGASFIISATNEIQNKKKN